MPDQKYIKKTIETEELNEQAVKFDFITARRLKWNIYDALTQELYEEGCLKAAYHIQNFAHHEKSLLMQNVIRESMYDNKELLFALFENAKYAEKASYLGKCGRLSCLKLLYQNVLLLEKNSFTFGWILSRYYDIVLPILNQFDPMQKHFRELRVRITYQYGKFLLRKGEKLNVAIDLLKNAMDICRSELWPPDTEPEVNEMDTMHQAVARALATACIQFARECMRTDPQYAVELAHTAVVSLAEVGLQMNKLLLCRAFILKIEFLIECKKIELAMKEVNVVFMEIIREIRYDYVVLKCDILKYKGICYVHLNQLSKALINFRQALLISCKYRLKVHEANVLMQIGQLYTKSKGSVQNAKEAFQAAKRIFIELQDFVNVRTIDYMLAKLMADTLFSPLLTMIKSHTYCDYFYLRQWKTQCKPFWLEDEGQLVEYYGEQLWSGDLPDDTMLPNETTYVSIDEVSLEEEETDESIIEEESDRVISVEGIHVKIFDKKRPSLSCLLNEFAEQDSIRRKKKQPRLSKILFVVSRMKKVVNDDI